MTDYKKNLLDEPDHNVMVLGEMVEVGDDSASTGGGIQLVSRLPQQHQQKNYDEQQQTLQQTQNPLQQNQPLDPLDDLQHHDYIYARPDNTIEGNNCNGNKKSGSRRRCCSRLARYCKGSVYLAFLSHFCFVIASLFYIKLSFVQLDWIQYTMVKNDLTTEILNTDDDVSWTTWAYENQGEYREPPTYLQLTRLTYGDDYTTWCTRGAAFFALVGALDWARYGDKLNIFMILAGLAGVLSGYSESSRAAAVWDAISVHLYFLESITLLKRVHYYPAHLSAAKANESMASGITNEKDNGIVDVGDYYLESSRSSGSSGGGGMNGFCCPGVMDGGFRDATTYMDENDDDDAYPFFRVGDLFFFLGSMLDVSVV